jgi:hypothetical protein
VWVIHDRVKPAAGQAMSAMPRLQPRFALQNNFAMCQWLTSLPDEYEAYSLRFAKPMAVEVLVQQHRFEIIEGFYL